MYLDTVTWFPSAVISVVSFFVESGLELSAVVNLRIKQRDYRATDGKTAFRSAPDHGE